VSAIPHFVSLMKSMIFKILTCDLRATSVAFILHTYLEEEAIMPGIVISKKTYMVDQEGYLIDFNQWDAQFAEYIAPQLSIPTGLTAKHWDIIYFIRNWYIQTGLCPLVYKACRLNKISIKQLQELFPTGYMRGACKIAGITYKSGYHGHTGKSLDKRKVQANLISNEKMAESPYPYEKSYLVDVRGFLIDPTSWDEQYAIHKAAELKLPELLTDKHWKIIYFLRNHFAQNGAVPTVYATCAAFQLEISELELLFPDGYHRGAIKIAGLRAL
jgi:tRNA 2-thiouridine synthesizing protein E